MVRKPMSEEQKAAARERLAKARAAKAEKQSSQPQTNTSTQKEPTPQSGVNLSEEQFNALLNRIAVAEAAIANRQIAPAQAIEAKAEMQGATFGKNGIQGVVTRYPIEQDYYPDPSERILNMPELSRFAPHENYEIKWRVEGVEYEKANITYAEPRFEVQILRIMFDDMGLPTNMRAIVGKHIQHEDENIVRMVARDMGLNITDERELMDEVRFQRIRRWVLDLLTPNRQQDRVESAHEMVIDGKVVPVVEISTNADKSIMVDTTSALKNSIG